MSLGMVARPVFISNKNTAKFSRSFLQGPAHFWIHWIRRINIAQSRRRSCLLNKKIRFWLLRRPIMATTLQMSPMIQWAYRKKTPFLMTTILTSSKFSFTTTKFRKQKSLPKRLIPTFRVRMETSKATNLMKREIMWGLRAKSKELLDTRTEIVTWIRVRKIRILPI